MQSHANNEQLLRYRDQYLLDVAVKQHIEMCDECLLQVRGLSELSDALKSNDIELLTEEELDTSWEKIVSSVNASSGSKNIKPVWLAYVASVMFAVFIMLQTFMPDSSTVKDVEVLPVNSEKPIRIASTQRDPQFEQLVAYSRLLENRLQAMPQPRLVRANTAGTVTNLQDQISMVDTRLSMQHQVPLTDRQRNALWQQRVNSMNNLYRVRAAQLQRVSY